MATPIHRPPRPPKHQVYARPLPIQTHPLPAFIPQHPLSILRIAWALLRELIHPPCSHTTASSHTTVGSKPRHLPFTRKGARHTAYLDGYTNAVHVTEPEAVRALWEQGFFGKGSLSRSEPEWLQRLEALNHARQTTANEVTDKRRRERREMKMQRAREEIEALEKVRLEETGALETGPDVVDGEVDADVQEGGLHGDAAEVEGLIEALDANGAAEISRAHITHPVEELRMEEPVKDGTVPVATVADIRPLEKTPTHPPSDGEPLINQEHLQLTPAETLFLTYGLGILTVLDPDTHRPLGTPQLLAHFARTSTFPPSEPPLYPTPIADIDTDNNFLLSYVVYHHFRSLGWVVRPGIKFSVDYLLYARGPVFSHAQFAVVILPAYTHPYWTSGEGARSKAEAEERRRHVAAMEKRDWWWFHNVSRVQAQVLKSLVLCYVDVPPPLGHESKVTGESDAALLVGWQGADIGALLRRYRVKEIVCRRWTPQRNLK